MLVKVESLMDAKEIQIGIFLAFKSFVQSPPPFGYYSSLNLDLFYWLAKKVVEIF